MSAGADFDTEGVLFAAGFAAGAASAEPLVAAGAVAAGVAAGDVAEVLAGFRTPPWPLHAPRPVAADVVPSLHVVGSVEAACPGIASVTMSRGAAKAHIK